MQNLIRKISLIIYYGIASKLPNYSYPGGVFYNWFRIKCLKNIIVIGANCRIMKGVYIGDGNNVQIGDNCRINENVRLDNVKIGSHVMIARDCVCLGKMHQFEDIHMPMEKQEVKVTQQTIIEDDVWIGLRVILMPGINVKKGTIIGAAAVVTKDTDEYGIYAGVPAEFIRYRKNNAIGLTM